VTGDGIFKPLVQFLSSFCPVWCQQGGTRRHPWGVQ